jgi:hypothetical protein
MQKSIIVLLFIFSFFESNTQNDQIHSIISQELKIDNWSVHVHEENKKKANRYSFINYFIDSSSNSLSKVLSGVRTNKFLEESYYFEKDQLIGVKVDTKNLDNVTIADTRFYYYDNRKPIIDKYDPQKKSTYKKYLKRADNFSNRFKAIMKF